MQVSETLKEKTGKEEASIFAVVEQKSRILYLNDSIDKDSARTINRSLLLLDEISNDPIKIFINSPGGEVSAGFFIFDCIRFVRSPVYVIGAGLIASAAALIYLAVDKEYRISLPHARYMLHQPLAGMRGVVSDLEIHAREVSNLKDAINQIIAKATGKKISDVESDTDRDFWLSAQDAKNYGLVHKIITKKSELNTLFSQPKAKKDEKKSNQKTSTKSDTKKTVSSSIGKTPSQSSSEKTKKSSIKKANTKKK